MSSKTRKTAEQTKQCPCGSSSGFSSCCHPYIKGEKTAETAEVLMRSRYTAYTLAEEDYLRATWHPSTRPHALELGSSGTQWLGLSVKSHCPWPDRQPPQAEVEFVARYKVNGRAYRLEERSRFRQEDGRWYYVDGDINT